MEYNQKVKPVFQADATDDMMGYGTISSSPQSTHSHSCSEHGNTFDSDRLIGCSFERWLAWIPFVRWISAYQREFLAGDIAAAFTVSALYAPLCISFSLLAKSDPLSGLRSFTISTIIYALSGQSAQMIIGPEAPGSLLVGVAVTKIYHEKLSQVHLQASQLAGFVTVLAGIFLLVLGMARLGYVTCIISRAFMGGLISAMGFALLIEQAVTELGLEIGSHRIGADSGASAMRKLILILFNLKHAHQLTALVSFFSFSLVMIFR